MHKSDLKEYEVSCVVTCTPSAPEAETISCSAVFLTQHHVLAPGCILTGAQHVSLSSSVDSSLAFEVLAPATDLDTVTASVAKCIAVWKCQPLSVAIDKLFSTDVQPNTKDSSDEEKLDVSLISTFVLLELVEALQDVPCLEQRKNLGTASLGTELLICCTPFGSSHIGSFYNSWNSGLVSKVVEKNLLLLSDASCVPGGQGGVVFSKECMEPIGLVIYPVVWRLEECTGLSLIADISAILDSLYSLKLNLPLLPLCTSGTTRNKQLAESLRVIRVKNGSSWGSGILISKEYVLTCSHVLRTVSHSSRVVTVQVGTLQLKSTVVFKSQAEDAFDVAILKLKEAMRYVSNLPSVGELALGSTVYANGFGVFGSGATTIVTSGVIAKIVRFGAAAYKLVTSCKVHAGASGGALLNSNGDVIGMVTANTADTLNKVVYNQVSFGLSLDFMYPAIAKLCSCHDSTGFTSLEEQLTSDNQRLILQSKL